MKKSLTITASFLTTLAASSFSYSAPTVIDNTISWPANGWYQVQNAETYESICGGGTSCEVEAGTFHVINHSTGERFENIRVGLTADTNSPIEVSGNTISWPNDGWYQVQKADTHENICNGGRSCDVPNGVYRVINHSTGKRFNNVLVTEGAGLNAFDSGAAFYAALRQALINDKSNYYGGIGIPLVNTVPDVAVAQPPLVPMAPMEPLADRAPTLPLIQADVTTTNVQEAGVDEQDRVKVNAAGSRMYILNNNFEYFGGIDSIILPPSTANTTTVRPALDSPMLVDRRPAPGWQVTPVRTTKLRIVALDAETPDASELNDISIDIDLEKRDANAFYLYEKNGKSSAIITATGNPFSLYCCRAAPYFSQQSIIAKADVTDAETAAVTDTIKLDGRIISSRRIGDSLFFASRHYPTLNAITRAGDSDEQWSKIVKEADLSTVLPRYTRNGSAVSKPLVDPKTCLVATGVSDQPYYKPDIITLGVIDLGTMQVRDSECYLGSSETLYASTDSVFLATTRYNYTLGPVTTNGDPVNTNVNVFAPDLVWSDPRKTTDIHQFDITRGRLKYAGSGSVPGHLGWVEAQKPYRMSEQDGYLRVATVNDQQGPNQSPVLLSILKADGLGNLKKVGSLPNKKRPEFIGKPGERLYASRFIGDRGYLVTFRQLDPLYVINMTDASDPKIEGELEMPGYSNYLTPVDENHLLGIGMDAVSAEGGDGDGRGAWVQGMKLSLFDVADPAAPKEKQVILLGERGTNSVAINNPRAITIQAANERHPMRVSFGANVRGEAFPASSPEIGQSRIMQPGLYTGLHGFDVTGGNNANIVSRGALIIQRSGDGSSVSKTSGDDRSVIVNDAVFYVNGRDVYPAIWDDLANVPKPR